MNSKHVRLMQSSSNKWDLIGPKGNVLVENVPVYSMYEAHEWCNNYITSFLGWTFQVINKEGVIYGK